MCIDYNYGLAGTDALNAVTVASALLSTAGSLFIILSYHRITTMRSTAMQTIYYLSISDLALSTCFVVDGLTDSSCESGALCTVKAAGAQFFGLATLLWTFAIALNLDLTVLRRARIAQQPERLIGRLHLGVWGSAGVTLLVMGLAGTLGPAGGGWCWVRNDAQWARVAFFYGPLLAVFAYTLVVYARTRSTLRALQREAAVAGAGDGGSAVGGITSRLALYLLVFFIIYVSQIARRTHDILYPDSESFKLTLLQAVLGPLQGLGNACIYGWSPRVRRHWSQSYPRACGFFAIDDDDQPGSELGAAGGVPRGRPVEVAPHRLVEEPASPPGASRMP